MLVKLLVSRSGPAGAASRGDEIEVDDAEAKRMFEAEPPQAIPVKVIKRSKAAARFGGVEKAVL